MRWPGRRGAGYVVVQLILLALIALAPLLRLLRPDSDWPAPEFFTAVGLVLGALGAVLALAGVLRLGVDNLSALPEPTASAHLIESGIYGRVRHPIYGGLLLGGAGWGLLTHSLPALALTAALWVLFEFKTRHEEAALRAKFKGYETYAARVHKFWPYIY